MQPWATQTPAPEHCRPRWSRGHQSSSWHSSPEYPGEHSQPCCTLHPPRPMQGSLDASGSHRKTTAQSRPAKPISQVHVPSSSQWPRPAHSRIA